MKLEMTDYGLDDTLKDMKDNLRRVLGKSYSKSEKDNEMYRVIGAIDALLNVCLVTEDEVETEGEEVKL